EQAQTIGHKLSRTQEAEMYELSEWMGVTAHKLAHEKFTPYLKLFSEPTTRLRQVASILGSALFLVVAPGTVAGLVPWWVSRWREAVRLLLARWGFGLSFGRSLPLRLSATVARMRSCRAATSILSPSWMSMARPCAAPLANVILTTFLYVSPCRQCRRGKR